MGIINSQYYFSKIDFRDKPLDEIVNNIKQLRLFCIFI